MSRAILTTLVVLSLAATAAAQPYSSPAPSGPAGNPSRAQIFKWLDVNHDGFLTLEEYLAAPWIKNKGQAAKLFAWMDKDKDGRVSLAEFLAAYNSYSGSDSYSIRAAYPGAWVWWRPWRYGWSWHGAGWRPGWHGGWYHVAHKGHGHGVVVHVHHGHVHHGHVHHPAKHHVKHPNPHKGKHPKHKKVHGHHKHKGHGSHAHL